MESLPFLRERRGRTSNRFLANSKAACLCFCLALLFICGCATSKSKHTIAAPIARRFNFQTDAPAYVNELIRDYSFGTNGQWTAHKRVPKPQYALHCFAVSRLVEQFYCHAQFEPTQPAVSAETYERLIRRVVHAGASSPPVTIPGYSNLREFSAAREALLKAESGGAWRSYVQRGNWRMIFPFSRKHQERTANQFLKALKESRPPLAHLICFPKRTINHAVLIIGAEESEREIRFAVFDPNDSQKPTTLTYDRASRTFLFPLSNYFNGGPVDAYQIYYRWNY